MDEERRRELVDSQGLSWLVSARNQVQLFMLKVHESAPPSSEAGTTTEASPELRQWLLFVGAGFSLWRAVFLVDPKDVDRQTSDLQENATAFLEKVIQTNAVTFGDDRSCATWSSGYYLNNARYRVKALAAFREVPPLRPGIANARIREVWNETFLALLDTFHGFVSEGKSSKRMA